MKSAVRWMIADGDGLVDTRETYGARSVKRKAETARRKENPVMPNPERSS